MTFHSSVSFKWWHSMPNNDIPICMMTSHPTWWHSILLNSIQYAGIQFCIIPFHTSVWGCIRHDKVPLYTMTFHSKWYFYKISKSNNKKRDKLDKCEFIHFVNQLSFHVEHSFNTLLGLIPSSLCSTLNICKVSDHRSKLNLSKTEIKLAVKVN